MGKQIDFEEKRTEQELSSIGAKVADAADYAGEIERLSELQGEKLEAAQAQLGDLYERLDECPKGQAGQTDSPERPKAGGHGGTDG